jgi:undecaprenyl-diphosphatase
MLQRWAEVDRRLSVKITAHTRHPLVRTLASITAHSGDSLIWLLTGGWLWSRPGSHARMIALRILSTVLITSVLSATLKQLVRRRRPTVPARGFYNAFDRYSFPSGHAVRVGALTVLLSAELPGAAIPAVVLWGLAVCVSRIALEVHFASDVGIGLVLGWVTGILLMLAKV